MKKLVLCSALFISMMSVASVSQAAVQWQNYPWRLYAVSYFKTGIFGPYYKACHWKKTAQDPASGTYQVKLETTYTGKFSGCPAPLSTGSNIPTAGR